MAQSRDERPSRTELVVLACLSQSKPPAEVEIGEVLQQLALTGESVEAARRRAAEILAALVRRAWVSDGEAPRRRKKASGPTPRKLTDSGKRALREAFDLKETPTWAQVRDKHFPSKALGIPPGSEKAAKACSESALIAAVLGVRLGISDVLAPMDVCDAAIADALGMARGKLTLDRLRAHVLSRLIDKPSTDAPSPEARGYAGKLAAWIAGNTIGANGTKPRMARAVARRWVCGETDPLGGTSSGRAPDASAPNLIVVGPGSGGRGTPAISGNEYPARAQPLQGGGSPPGRSSPGPVQPDRSASGGANGPAVREVASAQTPPSNFLEVVRDVIPRVGAEGRFGEKVYVSAIWRTIERDRKAGGISLDSFKTWLVNANRDGKLVLARADLIGAMDAKQITESEITDRGATFHFVLDQRIGTAASQRGSHAG